MKKLRYHDIGGDNTRDFVSFLGCDTLNDMIAKAQERENYLEHLGKRKLEQNQFTVIQEKRHVPLK